MRLEMRIKLILAIAVGLLFCSLATLEFPELVTLSDNTSNDFSLVLLGSRPAVSIKKKQTLPPQKNATSQVTRPAQKPIFRDFDFAVGLQSPNDFLRLFCIQRT
jgi:hypothetical protein